MTKKLFFLIFLLFRPVLVLSQPEKVSPELIFNIDYQYFPKLGHELIGATAMEYHDGFLFIAMYNKVLKVDMQGNVVNIINPERLVRIKDIAFFNNELVIWSPSTFENLIFYRNTFEHKADVIKFHATNENNLNSLSAVPFYYEAAWFLISADDHLFVSDHNAFFPLDWLEQINVTSQKKYIGKNVYVNGQKRKPLDGFPISECERVNINLNPTLSSHEYHLEINNFCLDTTEVISKPITGESYLHCKIAPLLFYKNDFLNNYFFYGGFIPDTLTTTNLESIVALLDEKFNVMKLCYPIEYLEGNVGPSPWREASFTYDEKGNVYYCTNYFDRADIKNSFVKIFKIESNK